MGITDPEIIEALQRQVNALKEELNAYATMVYEMQHRMDFLEHQSDNAETLEDMVDNYYAPLHNLVVQLKDASDEDTEGIWREIHILMRDQREGLHSI